MYLLSLMTVSKQFLEMVLIEHRYSKELLY